MPSPSDVNCKLVGRGFLCRTATRVAGLCEVGTPLLPVSTTLQTLSSLESIEIETRPGHLCFETKTRPRLYVSKKLCHLRGHKVSKMAAARLYFLVISCHCSVDRSSLSSPKQTGPRKKCLRGWNKTFLSGVKTKTNLEDYNTSAFTWQEWPELWNNGVERIDRRERVKTQDDASVACESGCYGNSVATE